MTVVVEISNLVKRYKELVAVDHFSIQVKEGEIYGLLGPNGCGIAHKPDLIILDEPTVAVDPQSRNKILDGIKQLAKEGKTIIYTTHYMEEVERICDRLTIMDKGRGNSNRFS